MGRTDQRAYPIALFVVAAALLLARFTFTPAKQEGTLVKWVSPARGAAVARETGKPMLIDFTAEWCAPCKDLDREVFGDRALAAEINSRFVPVRVTDRKQEDGRNTPAVEALEQRYAVRGFPTVVFTDANGIEQGRIEGFRGRERFERTMERVR